MNPFFLQITAASCVVPRRGRRGIAAMVWSLGWALCVAAAEPTILGEPRRPTDLAEIRSLEEESRLAVLQLDFPTLERIWSERFVVNTPGNFVAPNRAAVFAIFRRTPAGLYRSYEKNVEYVVFTDDVAIVMGAETVVPVSSASEARPVQRRFTNLWKYEAGRWRLIARQATIVTRSDSAGSPVANPVRS